MNRLQKGWGLLLIFLLLLPGVSLASPSKSAPAFTILFTHDLHDNLLPFDTDAKGKLGSVGGFARLEGVIKQQKAQDPELLLVDGGDFSMGTLFQTIFSREAPELRLMGQMGYDVVTLGNHEFDFRPAGLAGSLAAAKNSKERLPRLVAGNMAFPADDAGKMKPDLAVLKKTLNTYGVKPYTVLERQGYRIGVFGIIGEDAASNAPMAGVKFTDPLEQAEVITEQLQKQEKADLIVCLSHSGTETDLEKSEDVILAQKVPAIDVIISGHTHTKLDQPIIIGDTTICSAGEYGENLGRLTLQKQSAGIWKESSYQLLPIDNRVAADTAVSRRVESFKKLVQRDYLDPLGMSFGEVLAYAPFAFAPIRQIAQQHAEQPLGNLISDAYIYAVKQAEGKDYQPVTAAIVPNGTIRASIVRGDITVADAYNISSLGIGPDTESGYPLIAVYLTGKELKNACEVDASITPLMQAAQIYMSGITYTFNPHRLIFNKVTDAAIQKRNGSRAELDDNRLYRVIVGLYSAQMLSVVGDKSFGLLSVVPKDQTGKPITDFEARVIRDKKNGHELKEWVAIAQYLQSFDRVNGVSQIPDYYKHNQGRKIVDQDTSLMARISWPNAIAGAVYGLVTLLLLLIILAVRQSIRKKKRKSYKISYIR